MTIKIKRLFCNEFLCYKNMIHVWTVNLPEVVVSRGAVRLPEAESVVFVPLGVSPGAPDG